MSSRASELGGLARQNEQRSQELANREMREDRIIEQCAFQFSSDLTLAVTAAIRDFNAAAGADSQRRIQLVESGGAALKLARTHAPLVWVTVRINYVGRFILIEHARKDREGMKYEPSLRLSLVVENNWLQISRDGELISDNDFAGLLLERFV